MKELALSDGTLAALGWSDELEAAFTTIRAGLGALAAVGAPRRLLRPAASAATGWRTPAVVCATTRSGAGCRRSATGCRGRRSGNHVAIEALLTRRTKVSRKTPWLKAEEHILVANVDTVFLVAGLDQDFNPRRLERYLTAAWDSGADPVIVLTKLDVCDDFEKLAEAEDVAVGVPVFAVSNVTGEGIESSLCGPRGRSCHSDRRAGKSTLVNRLAGRTLMPTGDLRNDGRGRHDGIVSCSSCGGSISSTPGLGLQI